MAHLFVRARTEATAADGEDCSEWNVAVLDGGVLILTDDPANPVRPVRPSDPDQGAARLLRCSSQPGWTEDRWVILTGWNSRITLGGASLSPLGIRGLRHQDEILAPGLGRVYFSTELLPCISPFPGGPGATCPRCRQPIAPGSPAVRCDQCRVWFHQDDDYPCWTYAPTCSLCSRSTELTSEYQWTPG